MIRRFLFGLTLCVGVAFLSPVSAQTSPEQNDSLPSSERDTFSNGLGDGLSPFDLIHSINSIPAMSPEEYRNQQDRNLDSAASEFRRQQQQLLQQSDSPEEESFIPED